MKAIVYEGPNKLNYTDVPDVSPAKGEVKLRIKACGICGSDVAGYQGLTGRRLEPMIMGHEFCGQVAECAEGVEKLKVGDMVIFSQYAGTEVKFEGEEYTIMGQRDILAKVEK